MTRLVHSFFLLLASATDRELARHVQYLKEENRILRERLPKRITVTARERRRLLKFGKPVGPAIKDLITIVSPRTFARWVSAEKSAGLNAPKKSGRRPTAVEIRQLIAKLASETGWGYSRIQGELRRLGIRKISRTTILNILREQGIDPAPKRGPGSWRDFMERHAKTLWACDFLSKPVWTLGGRVDMYLLVFIHIQTRRIWVSKATPHPDSRWVAQQARNMCLVAQEEKVPPTCFLRDRDSKFTRQFDGIFRSEGIAPIKLPPKSPNLNAFCERVIQSLKHEALDHFIVLCERHLNHIVGEWVRYYHELRPHQAIGNVPPTVDGEAPAVVESLPLDDIVCHQRLGGLLKHYERRAA